MPEQYANRKDGAKKMRFSKDKRICAHRQHQKDACRAVVPPTQSKANNSKV